MHADVTLSVEAESVTLSEGCNPSFAALFTTHVIAIPGRHLTGPCTCLCFMFINIVKNDCLVNPFI